MNFRVNKPPQQTEEKIMTKFANAALLAALLLTGVSVTGAEAVTRQRSDSAAVHNPHWTDLSDPYGGYSPNSPQGNRAFWDYQARQGTNR
jgi:hypothetical protein